MTPAVPQDADSVLTTQSFRSVPCNTAARLRSSIFLSSHRLFVSSQDNSNSSRGSFLFFTVASMEGPWTAFTRIILLPTAFRTPIKQLPTHQSRAPTTQYLTTHIPKIKHTSSETMELHESWRIMYRSLIAENGMKHNHTSWSRRGGNHLFEELAKS